MLIFRLYGPHYLRRGPLCSSWLALLWPPLASPICLWWGFFFISGIQAAVDSARLTIIICNISSVEHHRNHCQVNWKFTLPVPGKNLVVAAPTAALGHYVLRCHRRWCVHEYAYWSQFPLFIYGVAIFIFNGNGIVIMFIHYYIILLLKPRNKLLILEWNENIKK